MVHILFHKQHKKPVEGTEIEIYIYINIHASKQHSVFLSSFPLEDAAAAAEVDWSLQQNGIGSER